MSGHAHPALKGGMRLDQLLTGMVDNLDQAPPQEGVILTTVVKDGDPCWVSLENEAPGYKIGPCSYMPRGTLLPSQGCRCLVVVPPTGQVWIAAWWPYA